MIGGLGTDISGGGPLFSLLCLLDPFAVMADVEVPVRIVGHVLFFADLRSELLRSNLFVVAWLDERLDPFRLKILQIFFTLIACIAYDSFET